jgi:long-chain acyl-CoA synthetase
VNLAENLERTARARGRAAALTSGDRVTTFGELDRDSRRVAGCLARRGVRPGDLVGLAVPNVPEFAALYYGILRLGAVVVPTDPMLGEPEMAQRLRDAPVRLLVSWSTTHEGEQPPARAAGVDVLVLGPGGLERLLGDAPELDRVEPRAAADTAVIVHTAGTTGEPRGVELTHGNLARSCEVVVNDLVQLTSEDVVLGALPLFHAFGQTAGLNAAVRAGACLALLTRFDGATALRTLQDQGVTVMQGVPAMYAALLQQPDRADHDLSRLRVGISGGAPMPVRVLLGFEEAFDCLVLEGYGLTETSSVVTCNRRDRRRVGSVGTPVTGVHLRVVGADGAEVEDGETGELLVRGHLVMKGYFRRPEDTAATVVDGWLHTGDVGVRDEDGFLHVVERAAEVVDGGGLAVHPREVEDVLQEHPDVVAVAVIVLPHPTRGTEVGAVVTLRPHARATGDDLRDFVRARVAPHECPRTVDVVDEIPTTSTGTILKRAIRLEARA